MALHRVNQGYTVPIAGTAKEKVVDAPLPDRVALLPTSFPGIKPKADVQVGDVVRIGTRLFHDKDRPEVGFTSPLAGKVAAINLGPRRSLQEIVIERGEKQEWEKFRSWSTAELQKADSKTLADQLFQAGLMPFLRSRPFNRVASMERKPKAVFVNAMDTAPLAANPEFTLQGCQEDLEFGLQALTRLADVPLHLCHGPASKTFSALKGAELHEFHGRHPAGLVGTHISRIAPINRGECVWTIHARDLVFIGHLLRTGQWKPERIVALAGPGVKEPTYLRTVLGAPIATLAGERLAPGPQRLVSGNVLMGQKVTPEGYLGFYDDILTVLPEGGDGQFLGWLTPGFNIPSFSGTVASSFLSRKLYAMNTLLNGGPRAMVQSGIYEEVVALDIHPEFLIKAAITQNVEDMEKLGIYEVAPEDFALCAYICPSKTEITTIIQQGLDLMEKEG